MTQANNFRKLISSACATACITSGALFAGDYSKAIIDDKMPIEDPWSICDIFDYATLYERETGFIKEISLNGRYHGQYVTQSEDLGGVSNGFNQWQDRRARLGLDIVFGNGTEFFSSLNISNSSGSLPGFTRARFFDNFDEIGLSHDFGNFDITAGKQKQKITREYSTSSKRIKTIERSPIVNEVADKKPWGVTVGFETGELQHTVGAWITGLGSPTGLTNDWNWPRSDSRGSLSYNLEVPVSDVTDFYFDYVFVNNSEGTKQGRGSSRFGQDANYQHTLALGTFSDLGRLDLTTDFILAFNRERSGLPGGGSTIPAGDNTLGVVIMPTYEITEKLEAVFKYGYMESGQQQRTQRFGDRLGSRLRVADYHTAYVGLNYYVCGDKFKVMAGYEYASGKQFGTGTDVDSSSWLFGVRTYF
tara:strand:+ start:2528 stop:3781 length:1254 start_codon:yes stop_codon:yes gene_type:complete